MASSEEVEIFRSPEGLLRHLGIVEPAQIDIEAICQFCGATVEYERLEGHAARILGAGDRAIITIDGAAPRGRQRFSAAHELGHWILVRPRRAPSSHLRSLRAS